MFLVFDSIADEARMPSPPENGRSVSSAHHPLKFIDAQQPLAQRAVETRDVGLKLKQAHVGGNVDARQGEAGDLRVIDLRSKPASRVQPPNFNSWLLLTPRILKTGKFLITGRFCLPGPLWDGRLREDPFVSGATRYRSRAWRLRSNDVIGPSGNWGYSVVVPAKRNLAKTIRCP